MRRIAVINQKGGVGKTTTTVNLGAALARLGRRVLIVDLDPQCNLTVHVDVDPSTVRPSLYELFRGKATLAEISRPTGCEGLWVAPASVDLAGMELELVNEVGREVILADALDAYERDASGGFDALLIDCPPSLGLLSLNALVGCNELLVPIQGEFFALQGLGKLLEIVSLVQRRLNRDLRISSMVSCRHDPSTRLSKAVVSDVRDHFGAIFQDTVIRRDVKLAEAPSHGKTIFEYAPESRGAQDYLALARELLEQASDDGRSAGVVDDAPGDAPRDAPTAAEPGGMPPDEPRSGDAEVTPVADPYTGEAGTVAPDEPTTGEASAAPGDEPHPGDETAPVDRAPGATSLGGAGAGAAGGEAAAPNPPETGASSEPITVSAWFPGASAGPPLADDRWRTARWSARPIDPTFSHGAGPAEPRRHTSPGTESRGAPRGAPDELR